MKVRAGEATDPVVRMILSGVAEHLRAGNHALLELFGKRGQRSLVHAKCAQAVPGEGHRHPALVLFDRSHDIPRPTAPFQESPTAKPVRPRRCETKEIRIVP